MWPRDAYPGQFVAALCNAICPETDERLVRGKVYAIQDISIHFGNVVYFHLQELPLNIVRYDLLKPLDPKRLEVFRNVQNSKDVRLRESV